MKPTLVVLAAGMGSRYGGLKQVDPVGPSGEAILDYSVYDAIRGGFGKVVFVIRKDFEAEFQARVGAKFADRIQVEYAFQDVHDLPEGFAVPEGRTQPWGTAHAVRAARGVVREPFAVINADDFYGRTAFARLGEFLSQTDPAKMHFAMVGFQLGLTLSENGSVSRGVCEIDREGFLTRVTEMFKLVRAGDGVENREDPAAPVTLAPDRRVSMNCWGFTPAFFDQLEDRFEHWLEANVNREKSEWYLPYVVAELIAEGRADCRMLPTDDAWVGVTYREDKPAVMAAINRLVEAGEYPRSLLAP